MRIHITQTTKQFLPDKVYQTSARGVIDIPGKACLKTYSVDGKFNKTGNLETLSYLDVQVTKEKVDNPKWIGFKLI